MSRLPTISKLAEDWGFSRQVISALIAEHDVPTEAAGPAVIVTPQGMKTLVPVLERLRDKSRARRRKVGTR